MMQQATDFLDESNALNALVGGLSDRELATQTAFKGWTIDVVIGHLHTWNWAADLSLRDGDAFQDFFATVKQHIASGGNLNQFERNWLDGLRGRALLDTWSAHYPEVAERFGEAEPSKRVKWAGPDMSVRSSISARLMETWAHGQEVYDQLGVLRENTDRVGNIVFLGLNTYGWTFNVRGETPPQPVPHLKLTAPSGESWVYGEPSESELIEGLAEQFCQVVTQVRNVADTDLRVVGANAASWMSKAQCFAGAPQEPPAPGTRRTQSA